MEPYQIRASDMLDDVRPRVDSEHFHRAETERINHRRAMRRYSRQPPASARTSHDTPHVPGKIHKVVANHTPAHGFDEHMSLISPSTE